MPPKKNDYDSCFLTSSSTYWVTLARLALILLQYLSHIPSSANTITATSSGWTTRNLFYNSSFLSVLIRPHESLPHLEEAHAIRALSKSNTISSFYLANDFVRIPPLVLVMLSPIMETSDSGLWLSILLLLVDFLISYMLEQIGRRLLVSSSDNKLSQPRLMEEDDLQKKSPDTIRPQYAHIFPIYRCNPERCNSERGVSFSEEQQPKQESNNRELGPLISMGSLPLLTAQLYYWSPFTVLPTGLFHCWQNIVSLFLVASIYESLHCSSSGSLSMASFYLSVAAYMEPHHVVYVIPIVQIGRAHV